MVQIEFKNDINPIAIFINIIPLMGAISGLLESVQFRLVDEKMFLYTIFTFLLSINFIRLVRKKVIIELHDSNIAFRSMFGWKKVIKIDNPLKDFLIVKTEKVEFLYKIENDFIGLFKDGIKAFFNLKRRNNLYYKNRLIYKGIRK